MTHREIICIKRKIKMKKKFKQQREKDRTKRQKENLSNTDRECKRERIKCSNFG